MRLTALLAVAGAAALTPATTARSHVAVARLVSPSLGFVATSTGSRTRLFAVNGRSWRDVTPPHVRFQPEDLVFVDRKHGWLVTSTRGAAILGTSHQSFGEETAVGT